MRDSCRSVAASAFGLVIATGCGRIAFDAATGELADALPSDGVALDTTDALDSGPCTWGNVTHLAALSSVDTDWTPELSPDGLTLVFGSDRSGTLRLYISTRPTTGDAFGAPQVITEVEVGATAVTSPAWSGDGSRLFYLYHAGTVTDPRSSAYLGNGQFGGSVDEPALPGSDWAFSPDNLEVFYFTYVGAGDADLGYASRPTVDDFWSFEPELLATTNRVGEQEGWPAFDALRQALYMEALDQGIPKLAVATRPAKGMPFGPITFLDELGTGAGDPSVTRDGRFMVYGAERAGGLGGNDLYSASCE